MALLKPDYLISHPVRAGLLWTVLFVPLLALLTYLQGGTMQIIPLAALLAVPAGIAWGYTMRAYLMWRQRDAR